MGNGPRLLALLLLASGVQCKKAVATSTCRAPLVVVVEPATDEMIALPSVGLEDVEVARESNGCEYGDERRQAKLGPLFARYEAYDYKGQSIDTMRTLYLSSSTCRGTEVPFVMLGGSSMVRLRHDPARGLYVVTHMDQKKDALLLQTAP